jgi:hypothetical protein
MILPTDIETLDNFKRRLPGSNGKCLRMVITALVPDSPQDRRGKPE